jgi:sugar phosphate isomerase/epimerase
MKMQARRDFLKASAAAVAGAALPWPAWALPRQGTLDRIGVQLYTVRKLMERDVRGTLERVAEIGFKEVEFAGYFGQTPEQVKALLTRLGLDAPAGHMPYESLNDATSWGRVLDQANRIGHRYIIIAWTPQEARRTLDDWRRVADKFNWAGRAAKEAGLSFAYHNHEFEFKSLGGGPIPFDLLLAETDPELVEIEMDLYWITLGGFDPLSYFDKHPGRFPMVHVKDMKKGGERPLMVDVGKGEIDFAAIFARRETGGIRHFFVEHDEPADPLTSIRESYQYLRRLEF